MPDRTLLMTPQEAAHELRVGIWTIKNLHRVGRLRGVIVARKLRFTRAALDGYVRELERPGGGVG